MNRGGPVRDLGRLLLGHAGQFRDRRLQEVAARALRESGRRRAWVVSVLNVTLRGRRFLREALWLKPRRMHSRLAFSRGPAGGYPGPHRSLSLLCPSRGRTRQVVRMLSSIERTAAVPARVEVLFYVDSDDPELARYRVLFGNIQRRFRRLGRCELIVGEPIGVPAAWNELAAAAAGDLLLMANDDQRYVSYGWDVLLDAAVSELTGARPDGVLCLFFDGGQYPDGARDFPVLTRRWYETLGYFTPTIFSQWEVETWIFDIADRLGRLYRVPGVYVDHLHYQDYKAPFDATYRRHRMTSEKSLTDHALFLRTAGQRDEEAGKLQAVIDGAQPGRGGGRPGDAGPPAADSFWFTRYLLAQQERVAGEIDAWLAGGEGAAERAAPPPGGAVQWPARVSLFAAGGWTAAARQQFPVITDVMAAVPDAILPGGSAVQLWALLPGQAGQLAAPPGAASLQVFWGIRVPDRSGLAAAGQRAGWGAGHCLVLDGRAQVTARNDGQQPLVVLGFAVPRAAGGSAATSELAAGRDA
jgi:glycosyl transferase/beta-hydroxylase protein BlmF